MAGNKRILPAREYVAAMLRKRILTAEYHANQMLTLDEVAKDADCSRTPVREAFQMLAAEGLIELSPNRGALVKELTLAFIEDQFWMREFLETEATARACLSRTRKMPIRLAIESGRRAVEKKDVDAFNDANIAFHMAIWEAAESPKLKSFLSQLWNGLSLDMAISSEDYIAVIQSEHEVIWQAIDNSDEAGARMAIKHHLGHSLKNMMNSISNTNIH